MLRFLISNRDPDGKLVKAAREGDPRAFDLLVSRHQARVALFIKARLDAGMDADDVVQEVFLAAWRNLPKFRGGSLFKTWLFGIAANLTANHARKQCSRLQRSVDWQEGADLIDRLSETGADPLSDGMLDRMVVREGLAQLSEPKRQALELYYYGDLTLREIAETMDVNLSTLKYWFYEAHRELRANVRLLEHVGEADERGVTA